MIEAILALQIAATIVLLVVLGQTYVFTHENVHGLIARNFGAKAVLVNMGFLKGATYAKGESKEAKYFQTLFDMFSFFFLAFWVFLAFFWVIVEVVF